MRRIPCGLNQIKIRRLFLTQGTVADQYADWKRGQDPDRQHTQYLGWQHMQQEEDHRDQGGRTEYRYRAQWLILAPHLRFSPRWDALPISPDEQQSRQSTLRANR
jgi:hypothetical protein